MLHPFAAGVRIPGVSVGASHLQWGLVDRAAVLLAAVWWRGGVCCALSWSCVWAAWVGLVCG